MREHRIAAPVREYDEALDSYESYFDAIREIGIRVKAGMPLPEMFKGAQHGEATSAA
jgi:hypothetical protein